ncbi:MAG: hypothetical protein P8074_00890 [Anaerolineales bacterium]|jgi:hypothetical protein
MTWIGKTTPPISSWISHLPWLAKPRQLYVTVPSVRKASGQARRKLSVQEVIISLEGLHRALPLREEQQIDSLSNLLSPYLLQH